MNIAGQYLVIAVETARCIQRERKKKKKRKENNILRPNQFGCTCPFDSGM